tara:strand:+ start:109 stop:318 length:210 start_codon:yes stop_codon:yes gene_type:complete
MGDQENCNVDMKALEETSLKFGGFFDKLKEPIVRDVNIIFLSFKISKSKQPRMVRVQTRVLYKDVIINC